MSTQQAPVRLRVAYRRPEVALGEFTRSVSRRTVSLRSPRAVAVGTQFVFELVTQGMTVPVEVVGEVERVLPLGGEFLVTVRYDPSGQRKAIEEVLALMTAAHAEEKVRAHLRVPLNLIAQTDLPYSPVFIIRDLSHGGMGVSIEAANMPKEIRMGGIALAELSYGNEKVVLHGEIVWAAITTDPHRAFTSPSFGVRFGKLREPGPQQLERLLSLRLLPPPAITARLTFGMDALSRMP